MSSVSSVSSVEAASPVASPRVPTNSTVPSCYTPGELGKPGIHEVETLLWRGSSITSSATGEHAKNVLIVIAVNPELKKILQTAQVQKNPGEYRNIAVKITEFGGRTPRLTREQKRQLHAGVCLVVVEGKIVVKKKE